MTILLFNILGYEALGAMLFKNRTLQTLGLAKNGIEKISSLENILLSIGKFPLSEEQYISYRN